MLKRISEIIWFTVVSVTIASIIIIPTYQIGVIGWFIGVGFIMTVITIIALVESTIRYVICGYWEFPVNSKE